MLWLHARADLPGRGEPREGQIASVSAHNDESLEALWDIVADRASASIPKPGDLAMNTRQAGHCRIALAALDDVGCVDELVVADALRRANVALARITGDVGIESMLDALFGKFCIGK
jgi:tRNA modification GTPase